MLRVLLLTASPLLCSELRGVLEAPEAGGLQLSIAEPLERDLARAMGEQRPQVVLVPLDGVGTGPIGARRDLRLVERLVGEWRVPVIALGMKPDDGDEAAAAAAGAVSYLPRERWRAAGEAATLRGKIQAAARVKVLRSWLADAPAAPAHRADTDPVRTRATRPAVAPTGAPAQGAVIVIGASAGGPSALRELLRALPRPLRAAMLVVQHMPPAFGRQLAADLRRTAHLPVAEARVGDALSPGRVLLVPGRQAALIGRGRVAAIVPAASDSGRGQVIDRTMASVAKEYGARAIGVILTGMGEDGVAGLTAIKARGGATFGQDEASCLVYGMPRGAMERGVIDRAASPAQIGAALGQLGKMIEG